jgi:EmrB/QacA subfamily drug resistance transporter
MDRPDSTTMVPFHLRDLAHGVEPPPAPLVARQRWYPGAVVALTCIGAFIGQLDASIVQLALPKLADVFDVTLPAVSWVSLGYLLAFAAFLPIWGRLCEIHGRKLLYLGGYLLFSIATALCGFASNIVWLVVFRVLQGIGGALLGANSIVILVSAVDRSRRAGAIGIFGAAQAVGVSAGPVVGGILIAHLGWPWVFWVAVPFGLFALVAGWWVLPVTAARTESRIFDWRGALLLTPALILLVLAINQLPQWGVLSPAFLGSVVAVLVLMTLLLRQETRTAVPLVDLRLFRHAAFSAGAAAVVLGYGMLYAMFFLMAFALTRGFDESAEGAGLHLAVIPVALGLTAPFTGRLCRRFGARRVPVAGMALCALALLALCVIAVKPGAKLDAGLCALAVFGAGLGLFIAPNTNNTIGAAPPELSGEAGALLNLMRVLGTSFGVAGAASMLSWRAHLFSRFPADWRAFAGRPLAACLSLVRGRAVA